MLPFAARTEEPASPLKTSGALRLTQNVLREKYEALGGSNAGLGMPISPEETTADGIGHYVHFEHGSIFWTAATGAWSVHQAIREKWASMGWERGCLGYPTSDESRWRETRRSYFQNGHITWTPEQGAVAVCYNWFAPANRLYQPRSWQTDEGLPHNSVYAIAQTRDGYLWVATHRGLTRFDGVRFTVPAAPGAAALSGQIIRCLLSDRDGALWIGLEKGDLFCFQQGQFTRLPLPEEKKVKALLESRDGSLWIGTTQGVGHWQNGSLQWLDAVPELAGQNVLSLTEDPSGSLWVGTSRYLAQYQNGAAKVFREADGTEIHTVRALYCDRDNAVWIGTSGNGLVRWQDGQFRAFGKSAGLSDHFVSVITADSRGELWVGTLGGLNRRQGEKFVPELNSDWHSYETVFGLMEDHEGSLWLGTKEGLTRLRSRPFQSVTKQDGLSHNNIMSVCEDRHGTLWATTWGGGVCALKKDTVTVYNRSNGPLYDLLLSIHETRDGNLWIGGDHDGGLFRVQGGARYGVEAGIIDSAIRVIYEDRQTNLWLGTSGALYLRRDGKFHRFTTADGLSGNTIRALTEDAGGGLWVGTDGGLSFVQEKKTEGKESGGDSARPSLAITSYPLQDGSAWPVLALYDDGAGSLWIGTDGGGLVRMKNAKLKETKAEVPIAKERFTFYQSRHGLFSDTIFEILEDERGCFWMSCFSGIFRVKKKALDDFADKKTASFSCVAYGEADGMSSAQCNGISKPAGWKTKDGRLWFPTTRGVVSIDPNSIREETAPLSVVIEEVLADKKMMAGGTKPVAGDPVVILPGRGELEIHYTALSLAAAEKNQFKFKLEGLDHDWIEAGSRRVAYYNNLPPGPYTFRVIAANRDGVWNARGASRQFVLQPHYWQTLWFQSLAVLAGVGVVGATARYATQKRIQFRLQRLEQQHALEKERARIAQDMHDDLGARLTQILLLHNQARTHLADPGQTAPALQTASEVVRQTMDHLDALVWTVNPKNDSLDRLVTYLGEYAQDFLANANIRCRFELPDGELPDWPLSSEVRHHVFMVVKEALNNCVKYAGAEEVRIRIETTASGAAMTIVDNGAGFLREAASATGNGLQNMEKRMRQIGGNLEITSAPGKGTQLRLEIPMPG